MESKNRPSVDLRILYVIIVASLIILSLIYYYIHALQQPLCFTGGEIDLSQTSFAADGVIDLNGEWEFYWNQLLEPADFNQQSQENIHYLQVPGNWLEDQDGHTYKEKGYATYRMRIRNIPSSKYFGLKKANIRNSSKIYINGDLVLEDGTVSKMLQGSVGKNNSEVVYFELEDSSAEIIIQVANHEYIVGGIAKPITFGLQKALQHKHIRNIIFEITMILIVIIIGLFYLVLFLGSKHYRMKEPATLPLALSCLFFGFMNGIYSERVITLIFPKITLYATYRFGHFMDALSMMMVLLVINKVNKAFLSNTVRNLLLVFYSSFILCVLALPFHVYLETLAFYLFCAIIIHFMMWLWLFILFLKKDFKSSDQAEHGILVVAIFSIFLYWLDLMLLSLGFKPDMLVSFLAVAVYSISLAILFIMRYSTSYEKNQELSIQLIETFSTLDQTSKAVKRNELAFLQAQIKPHFLFNALSSIISLCYTDGEKAAQLLTDLSNYLKRSFDIDLKTEFITIENELKLIQAYVDIQKARFGDRIQVYYDIDLTATSFQISPLLIEPLMENAIRHGVLKNKDGGQIKLTIKRRQEGIYISVEDNGKGIQEEQIKAIKNKQASNLNASGGNGVSLMNVYARLRTIYEIELAFETTENGTRVYFTLPVEKKEV